MKNKKILIGVIAVIIVATIVVVGFTLKKDKEEPITTTDATTQETTIELPTKIEETETETTQLAEDDDTLKIDDVEVKTPTTTKPQKDNGSSQKPVSKDENKGDNVGIVINPDAQTPTPTTYSCGVAGHHCQGQETHNFIVSMEAKGCEHCGSHSCPSFYATDKWGNAILDATKCPEYNKKNDPLYYCQDCGKKVGDGSNGTCVMFTVDVKCPDCGASVSANTCHSH